MKYNFISIDRIINSVKQNDLLADINPEVIIEQAITVCSLLEIPSLTVEDLCFVKLNKGMAMLPLGHEDILGIFYSNDTNKYDGLLDKQGVYYRPNYVRDDNMFNSFTEMIKGTDSLHNHLGGKIKPLNNGYPSYSINNNVIHSSKKEGIIAIKHTRLALDKNGIPMILDDVSLNLAIENYIKKTKYALLFDLNRLPNRASLDRAEVDYAWYVGQVQSKFTGLNSYAEIESFLNDFRKLYRNNLEFYERGAFNNTVQMGKPF